MAYKQIHDTFWTDPKIRSLKPDEKLLFLYLISNSHSNYSGIYYLPKSLIAEETTLSNRGINRGMDTLSIGGFIKYDVELKIVWILKMLKFQSNDFKIGEKQMIGIINQLKRLHNSILIKDFLEYYKDLKIDYKYTGIDRGIDTPPLSVPVTYTAPVSVNSKFIKPTLLEVRVYCLSRKNGIDAETFWNHYESNGWKVGKNSMKSWKSAIITWEKRNESNRQETAGSSQAQSGSSKGGKTNAEGKKDSRFHGLDEKDYTDGAINP